MELSPNSHQENHSRNLLGILTVAPKLLFLIIFLDHFSFNLPILCTSTFAPIFIFFLAASLRSPCHVFFTTVWWKTNNIYQRTLILLWGSRGIEERLFYSMFILFLFCFSFSHISFIPVPFLLLFSSCTHPLSYSLFSVFVTDFWQNNLLQVSGN